MKKILIVEDNDVLLRVIKNRFVSSGWEVSVAENGNEVIPGLQLSKPDLVLLDLILPGKSGFEVLEDMKKDPELKHIPVLVVSNLGMEDDVKKALALGANDYFIKTQHQLTEIIEKAEKYTSETDKK